MARTKQTTRLVVPAGYVPPEPQKKWTTPATERESQNAGVWRTAEEVAKGDGEIYLADLVAVTEACHETQLALKVLLDLVHWPVAEKGPTSSSSSSSSSSSAETGANALSNLIRLLILLHADLPDFFAQYVGVRLGVFFSSQRESAELSEEDRRQRWQAVLEQYRHLDEELTSDAVAATLPLFDSEGIQGLRLLLEAATRPPSDQATADSTWNRGYSPQQLSKAWYAAVHSQKRARNLITPNANEETVLPVIDCKDDDDTNGDDTECRESHRKDSGDLREEIEKTLQALQTSAPNMRLLTSRQIAQMMATRMQAHYWISDARFQGGFLELAYTSAVRQIPFEQLWSQSVRVPLLAQLAFGSVLEHRLDIAPVLHALPVEKLARLAAFKQVRMQEPVVWSQYWTGHARRGDRLVDPHGLRNVNTHFVDASADGVPTAQLRVLASGDEYGYAVPAAMASAPQQYIDKWFDDASMHNHARVSDFAALPEDCPVFQRAREGIVAPLRELFDQRSEAPLPNGLRAAAYELFVQGKRRVQFVLPMKVEDFDVQFAFGSIALLPAAAKDYALFSSQPGADATLIADDE